MIENSRSAIDEIYYQLGHGGITQKQADLWIQKNIKYIFAAQSWLDRFAKGKAILCDAEVNAEKACQFIRNSQHDYEKHRIKNPIKQKLAKLEGFFFILSMRVLTEITFLPVSVNSSSKNKYFFYLKSPLSELIDGLSEKDKALLKFIKDHWSVDQRNELLSSIVGSSEALTVSYSVGKHVFTVKDVIESALGWREDKVCDLFPGFPVKKFDPPYEPKTRIRSKEHQFPIRRVLLEYRGSPHQTLQQSEREMKKILQLPFCKTTFLDKDDPLEEKLSSVVSLDESPEQKIDRNVDEALKYVYQNPGATNLKEILTKMLDHDDRDISFKQINYLYLKIRDAKDIDADLKLSLEKILSEMYSDKVLTSFSFPVKDDEDQYLKYLKDRYAITKKIPQVIEFICFIEFMDFNKFEIVLRRLDHKIYLEYVLKPGVNINEIDENKYSLLDHACDLGLKSIIDLLLRHGAKAKATDILLVAKTDIFSSHLIDQLIGAGANLGEAIVQCSHGNRKRLIDKIIKEVGDKKCEQAILNFCQKNPDDEYVKDYLEIYQNISPEVKTEKPIVAVSKTPHSVMFQAEQKKEKLLNMEKFSEEMRSALTSYQGQDKLKRKEMISRLIKYEIKTNLMKVEDVHALLLEINNELNRSSRFVGKSTELRRKLNPCLLDMLKKIDPIVDSTLEKDFSSHLASRNKPS